MLQKFVFLLISLLTIQVSLANVTKDTHQKKYMQKNDFWPESFYHGYLDVNAQKDETFYWFFESKKNKVYDPLVLWLNGGPGCGDATGILFENGPFSIKKTNKTTTLISNKYSWNSNTNLLYIDNPLGAGYSVAPLKDTPTDENQIAENVWQFLLKFYEQFPQLKGRNLYITGESYAGKYIPSITNLIVNKNKDIGKKSWKISDITGTKPWANLKGIMIGNGIVDPANQYPAYYTFSKHHKLMSKQQEQLLRLPAQFCKNLLLEKRYNKGTQGYCSTVVNSILLNKEHTKFNFNYYNINLPCVTTECYDFSNIETFMRSERVVKDLSAKTKKFESCNMKVYHKLYSDQILSVSKVFRNILAAGVDVLGYYGEYDFICNWEGGLAWMNAVDWKYKKEFNTAAVKKNDYGLIKRHKNFAFIKFGGAGHMVPMDQPELAQQMLTEFIHRTNEAT